MEGNIEGPRGNGEDLQRARNMTQLELAQESGQDPISWINAYAEHFNDIIDNDPTILAKLAEDKTHAEALEEVKQELYH